MEALGLESDARQLLPGKDRAGWARPRGAAQAAARTSVAAPTTDPGAARQQAEDLWDRHGRTAYALASALLGDEAAAMRAVALGMADFARSDVSSTASEARRSLARHVYWRSTDLTPDPSGMSELPPAMVWLAGLAQLQRACLAMCVFGGHSHQQAAALLNVPPLTVARLLTSGLQELSRLSAAPQTVRQQEVPL